MYMGVEGRFSRAELYEAGLCLGECLGVEIISCKGQVFDRGPRKGFLRRLTGAGERLAWEGTCQEEEHRIVLYQDTLTT